MKIIQVMPTVSFGDAVSNDARAIAKVIAEMGYKTAIYAENVDQRIKDPLVHRINKLPSIDKNDVVIFNHSTGTELCYSLPNMNGRKMMIYHNITPPEFFAPYSAVATKLTEYGYAGTKHLSDKIDYVMADSAYNAEELRRMGYSCEMFVRPILIPFEDYAKQPDADVLAKYSGDGYVNIVFVGRIAPNKKQEDIISAFAYYKKHVNPKSRLILVGSDGGMERYSKCLKNYADALMLEDVIFTGQISFPAILAYYRLADVFLCMSEHEGFCVPLLEAMYFETPIIAFDSSAIAGTLGGSGILIKEKDPVFVSFLIDRLMKDGALRDHVIQTQRKRLADFEYGKVRECFIEGINKFIEK
ncbi:MAG: glycosyltransferase family 4 protein [Clostridia bacterium]|nr:glycosyltransferase family 4 protein [Clostridia bacterium]